MNKIAFIPPPTLSVYFAGKIIAAECNLATWRYYFLNDCIQEGCDPDTLADLSFNSLRQKIQRGGELVWEDVACQPWKYAGPFFTSWHGAMDIENHETIFKRNMDSIRKCDMLFAFIETDDCYGTLAEIGFAHALGKSVYVVFDHPMRYRVRDYWFVTQCSMLATVSEGRNCLVGHFKWCLEREHARKVQAIKAAE
jgi:nucleoside 2-deoxyribosyltransferase